MGLWCIYVMYIYVQRCEADMYFTQTSLGIVQCVSDEDVLSAFSGYAAIKWMHYLH